MLLVALIIFLITYYYPKNKIAPTKSEVGTNASQRLADENASRKVIERLQESFSNTYGFEIAGLAYNGGKEYVQQHCHPFALLDLKREPENDYDHNTIAVWYGDRKIGSVPAGHIATVNKILSSGPHVAYIKQFRTRTAQASKTFFDVDVALLFNHDIV